MFTRLTALRSRGARRHNQFLYLDTEPALVGHWPLAINALDVTANANNGTLNGGMVFGSSDGRQYAILDGNDDCISVASAAVLEAGSAFSVSMGFTNTDLVASENYLAGKFNGGFNGWLLGKSVAVGGDFAFNVRTPIGNVNLVASTAQDFDDGLWHHAVGVKNGTSIYLYVDGALVGSATNAGLGETSGSADLYIGSHVGSAPWTGKVNGVRLYNRALTAPEIAYLATLP